MNPLSVINHPLFADVCDGQSVISNFLKFPTWYEYIIPKDATTCSPALTSLSDVWLIVAAVIEILLRIAALMAVGFVIYGGIEYATSQGSSDRTNAARNTLTAALVGLVICVIASIVVAFIAGSFQAS